MEQEELDELIQLYLRGLTNRSEERALLDKCLKDIELMISVFRGYKNDKRTKRRY